MVDTSFPGNAGQLTTNTANIRQRIKKSVPSIPIQIQRPEYGFYLQNPVPGPKEETCVVTTDIPQPQPAHHPGAGLEYDLSVHLGNMIKAVSKRWGISMTTRITAVEESYDRDGMSLSVTFGKPLLTLSEKLKRSEE